MVSTDWSRLAERVRSMSAQLAGRVSEPWSPPDPDDFIEGVRVLAFDGSLSATGWACIERAGSLIRVDGHGTLHITSELTGYRGTYEKASRLQGQMMEVVLEQQWLLSITGMRVIAWEAPPMHGRRTESTLIAGYLAYEISGGDGIPVTANHASKVLAGNGNHDKREITLAVARYVPEVLNRGWGDQNARDALAVGLTVLWDMQVAARENIN
jgi:Holliday junction resolvasome RuvABC endonuclease subunit